MRIPSGVTDQYICSTCKEAKSITDFGLDKKSSRGRKYACKECINAKRRDRYQDDNRRYHLKSKYGITPEQYGKMLEAQKNLCAICRESGSERSGGRRARASTRLYVDHDPVSGDVRGLLCHKCNVAIGLLYDDPARIDRAAKYVRGWPCV